MGIVIVILLLIIVILLFEINSKLPKRDPGKEAVKRALKRDRNTERE
jgi:hypothetical protein